MWCPKLVEGNPFKNYISMSYSLTLVDLVGGCAELERWWEPE